MKIIFFGDSITEGVFELIDNCHGGFDPVFDKEHVYHNLLTEKLKNAYPHISFEIVNSGIAGNSSKDGLNRIDSVINLQGDLVVVCFGLNDAWLRNVDEYSENMDKIFKRITQSNSKSIFMTPNMLNTYLAEGTLPVLYKTAKDCVSLQNDGVMDLLIKKGIEIAEKNGILVADAYNLWKKLAYYGIDTTKLLANKINHPTREMHRLFADVLFKTITENNLVK